MQADETLCQARLTRLANSPCILGEPDIISIRQTKISNAIFTQKKVEDYQENYINGLVFPSTAHFSSFISSRYKSKDPNKHHIRAKLYMFDVIRCQGRPMVRRIYKFKSVFQDRWRGQPLPFNPIDYERAYYSSFLRSIRPMNYPKIILYPLMNRMEILKPIVKNLVAFSMQHQLRRMDYELDICQGKWHEQQVPVNLSLEIIIDYCLDNKFTNLIKIIMEELRRLKSQKYMDLLFENKLKDKKYKEVVYQTAEKLLMHSHANQLKEYQIRALFELKKYSEIAYIGKTLIDSGGTSNKILKMVLSSLIELGEDHRFLKTLNLIYNLQNLEETHWRDVTHISKNDKTFEIDKYVGKLTCLSEYPELSFPFDNKFLNRLASFQANKAQLQKNSKEGLTVAMLDRVDQSLSAEPPFYSSLIQYIKQRTWNNLVKYRTECFWLESDFAVQEEEVRNLNTSMSDRYSFFEEKYEQSKSMEWEEEEFSMPAQSKQQAESEPDLKFEDNEEFEDGKMSEHDYEKERQLRVPSKCCVKVIHTARKGRQNDRKTHSKVQCNGMLEQTFFTLFNDLKLQSSLENWQNKLDETECSTFTQLKKQIAALILVKKGFLNHKLQQKKKCEQAFQKARTLTSSVGVNLVATYQLILLYIENKNAAGVEFYIIHLIKLLKNLGIDTFDIVPEWAKPILQFVVQEEGLGVIKNIHPLFKNVFGLYLRSNLSDEEVNLHLNLKK